MLRFINNWYILLFIRYLVVLFSLLMREYYEGEVFLFLFSIQCGRLASIGQVFWWAEVPTKA